MKELAYVWLADTHCGWENNEGAYGEVVIRVDEMLCELAHNQRILEHLTPDRVHVLVDGRIVAVGGPELAARVESEGFDAFRTAAA